MKKNSPTLAHHIAGILFGIAVFGGISTILSNFRSSEIENRLLRAYEHYDLYSSTGLVGPARVGIAKAMRRDTKVKLAFRMHDICEAAIKNGKQAGQLVQLVGVFERPKKVFKTGYAVAGLIRTVENVCAENTPNQIGLISSKSLRISLRLASAPTQFLAIAR